MEHITINSDRSVTVPVELRKIGVQYDHNVNTIEFVGPRYSGNVDLSTMTIYINYILSDKTPGKYKAENVIIDDQDDSLIRFNWTITRNVTKASGILSCLVCAKKTDKEGNEINHWNTDIFRLLSVSEGMENDPVIQEQYPDVITSLIQNVEEHDTKLLEFSGLNNRVTDLENNIGELKGEIDNIHIPEQVQPDWNQNDDTAADYVKNRPFYKETLESVPLYEMAVELSLHGDDIVPFYGTNEIHDKITSADKYLVRFDGVDYICTAVKLNNGYGLGNLSLLNGANYARPDCVGSSEREDTGEPFCIIDDQYYTPSTWFYAQTDGDHSYAVHKTEEIIHPISGEFIPDLGKLSEKIDNIHIPEQIQSDWTQNDETAPDYIKNKPFYDNSWVLDTSNVLELNDINSDVGFVLVSNNPDDFYLSDSINYYGKYKNTEYKLTTPYYPTYDCNAFRYTDDNGNETTICYVVRQENTKIYIRNAGKHYEISNPSIGIWVKRDPQFGNKASIYTKDVHKIDEKYLPDIGELKSDLVDKVSKKDYTPEIKTESMTQPVGKDENGKLWTTPGSVCTVSSVNSKTGAVVLTADDVHAMRDDTVIPTVPDKVSAFKNDAGYLTAHQDISGKLDADKLPEAVNDALAQAAASGEFDGIDGKSAYQYAQDGGYTGTETEFAEKLAQEQLTGTTNELTPTQVYDAVSAGIPVKVQYIDSIYGLLSFTAFNVAESLNVIVSQTIVYYDGVYVLSELIGNKFVNTWETMFTDLAQKTDIPSALPNPNSLTFTGAVTGSYNGSARVSVEIPSAVTDGHINELINTALNAIGVAEEGVY